MTHSLSSNPDILQVRQPVPGITEMWLNRPDKHNAFDADLIAAIHDTLAILEADAGTRVVILAGHGKSFCSGADLHYMKSMVNFSDAENVADAGRLAAMLQRLHDFPKPVITALHGNVFAGATGLVACSDIVIASQNACFCISEVRLGLVPAVISPFVVARIGVHQARRFFLTAEVFDATAAKAAGLVHDVVNDDALMAHAHAVALQLLNNAPGALANTKSLLRHLVPVPAHNEITEFTCQLIARVRAGAEAQQGLQAFFEKRPAPWSRVTESKHD